MQNRTNLEDAFFRLLEENQQTEAIR
jgi:hypothetical protein